MIVGHHVKYKVFEFLRKPVLVLRQLLFFLLKQILVFTEWKHEFESVDDEGKEEEEWVVERASTAVDGLVNVFKNGCVFDNVIKLFFHLVNVIRLSNCAPTLPVILLLSANNQFVKWICHCGLVQIRHSPSNHCEQNDSHWENVDLVASVAFLLQNFRCLVLSSSYARKVDASSLVTIKTSWKPKVGNFELIVVAEQQIFRLQVAMNNFCWPMQVLHGIKHLFKVVSGVVFREPTCFILEFNEWEKISLLDKLKHNEKYLDGAAWLVIHNLALHIPVN